MWHLTKHSTGSLCLNLCWVALLLVCSCQFAYAHGLAFASVHISEVSTQNELHGAPQWQILFQQQYNSLQKSTGNPQPNLDIGRQMEELTLMTPPSCRQQETSQAFHGSDSQSKQWLVSCDAGTPLAWIEIQGHQGIQTFFQYQPLAGDIQTQLVNPGNSRFTLAHTNEVKLQTQQTNTHSAGNYFTWGIEHIAEGFDHLAFVLLAILIAGHLKRIFIVVSAFTIGHCITLMVATQYSVPLQQSLVEWLIALSIVFLATEIIRNKQSLTLRQPAAIAILFGLLHGLGFASVLSDIGLPANQQWLALILFNLGVEAGQVCFVLLCLPFVIWLKRQAQHWPKQLISYGIGTLAMYWLVLRMAAL